MATRALGTKIQIGNDAIAGLTSIGGLELTADTIDVTTLDSTDGYRKFIGGFKDGGEVSISGFFEPTDTNGQNAFFTAFGAGTATAFSIIFPQGASWSFDGVVTGFTTSSELEDIISFEGTIKVSGKPTLGLTASAGLSDLALAGAGGSISPAFDNEIYYYTFGGVTADSITITATTAGAQTIKLYADGAYVQDLASAAASGAITMEVGSKKLTVVANEANKTQVVYEVIVVKVS